MTTKILIVSSDKSHIELLRPTVQALHSRLISASSTALGIFLAQKNYPDLILVCWEADDGEGRRLLREIQHDKDLSHIPVIAFSQIGDHDYCRAALKEGASSYVSLDMEQTELEGQISPYLRQHQDRREAETTE